MVRAIAGLFVFRGPTASLPAHERTKPPSQREAGAGAFAFETWSGRACNRAGRLSPRARVGSEHLDDGDTAVRVVVFEALGTAVRGRRKGKLESGLRSFFASLRSFTLATENGVDHVAGEHDSKVFTFRAVRHKFLGCGEVVFTLSRSRHFPGKSARRMVAQQIATYRSRTHRQDRAEHRDNAIRVGKRPTRSDALGRAWHFGGGHHQGASVLASTANTKRAPSPSDWLQSQPDAPAVGSYIRSSGVFDQGSASLPSVVAR